MKSFFSRNIANIISSIRIILAICAFFCASIDAIFLALFTIAQTTDLIDGTIARKLKIQSMLGANLDAAGDFLICFALWKVVFFSRLLFVWQWIWYLSAMAMHCVAALIAKLKFRKFYFVHSLSDKLLGASQFVLPYLFFFTQIGVHFMTFICSLATVAGVEAVLIVCLSRSADPDVLSVFQIRKINVKAETEQNDAKEETETCNT